MSQDEITKDEFDIELTRLFAEKNEPLSDHEFMQQILLRLEHQHRLRWIRLGFVTVAIMLLAAMIAPWVGRFTTELFSLTRYVGRLPGVDTISMLGMVLVSVVMIYRARRRI